MRYYILAVISFLILMGCNDLDRGIVVKKEKQAAYSYWKQDYYPMMVGKVVTMLPRGKHKVNVPEKYYLYIDGIYGLNEDSDWMQVNINAYYYFEVGDSIYYQDGYLDKHSFSSEKKQ